jgi:hypothetical protein
MWSWGKAKERKGVVEHEIAAAAMHIRLDQSGCPMPSQQKVVEITGVRKFHDLDES